MFILILLLDVHQPPDALHPSSPSDTLTPTLFLQLISMQIEYAISIFSPFPLILVTLLHSLYALLVHLIESNLYMSAAAAFPTIQPSNRRSASLRTDSHHDFLLRLQPQPAAVDEHMDSATIHPLHVAQKKKIKQRNQTNGLSSRIRSCEQLKRRRRTADTQLLLLEGPGISSIKRTSVGGGDALCIVMCSQRDTLRAEIRFYVLRALLA